MVIALRAYHIGLSLGYSIAHSVSFANGSELKSGQPLANHIAGTTFSDKVTIPQKLLLWTDL